MDHTGVHLTPTGLGVTSARAHLTQRRTYNPSLPRLLLVKPDGTFDEILDGLLSHAYAASKAVSHAMCSSIVPTAKPNAYGYALGNRGEDSVAPCQLHDATSSAKRTVTQLCFQPRAGFGRKERPKKL